MSEPLKMKQPADADVSEPSVVPQPANTIAPQPLGTNQQVIRIGSDQVTISDAEVVIEAKHEIADWEVRTHNAPAIHFRDQKYLLVEKSEARPPYKIRYVLRPWPPGKIPNPRMVLSYGTDTVAERDSSRRGETLNGIMWICLLPLYPFLGLLWSGAQQRLGRFGFVPRTITGLSIFTSFGLVLLQGVFVVVTINASMRLGKIMIGGMFGALTRDGYLHLGFLDLPLFLIDGLLVLACIADLCVRYSRYLHEDQWTGGFLEWLMPHGKAAAGPEA